jgi:hypothetical protein
MSESTGPSEEEQKLHAELAVAMQAEQELSIMGGCFDSLEADYIKAWRESRLSEERERERLWQAVVIVGKVRDHLKMKAANRKVAEKQLAEIARLGERRKFLGIV